MARDREALVFDTRESQKLVSICSMDVMINAPMTSLTLNRLHKFMMVGRETRVQTNKKFLSNNEECIEGSVLLLFHIKDLF